MTTFNLCKHYRDGSRSDTTVPPLLRYDSLPDGSYAVGRCRALHQYRSVQRSLLCQPEQCPETVKLHVQFYVEFQSPKALSGAKAI